MTRLLILHFNEIFSNYLFFGCSAAETVIVATDICFNIFTNPPSARRQSPQARDLYTVIRALSTLRFRQNGLATTRHGHFMFTQRPN